MEDDLKKNKKLRQPKKSTKINLIGCDTIVNSPIYILLLRSFLTFSVIIFTNTVGWKTTFVSQRFPF